MGWFADHQSLDAVGEACPKLKAFLLQTGYKCA